MLRLQELCGNHCTDAGPQPGHRRCAMVYSDSPSLADKLASLGYVDHNEQQPDGGRRSQEADAPAQNTHKLHRYEQCT